MTKPLIRRRAIRVLIAICVAAVHWVASVSANASAPSAPNSLLIVGANGSDSLFDVTIHFNRLIDPGAASDLFYYRCAELGEPISATPNINGTSVTVRFSNPQLPGSRYTVNVSGVVGLMGELQDPPSADVPFHAYTLTPGNLRLAIYDGLGIPDVGVPERELPPPSETFLIQEFDTRAALPGDSRENYLGRIDGFFIPPSSGNWVFHVRSDDSSELWLDRDDGYGLVKIAMEPECCGTFAENASEPISLLAGTPYRMIGIYRERSGADYMQVAAKLESDPTPPEQLLPLNGSVIGIYAEATNQMLVANIIANALVHLSADFEHPVLISCNWWNACLKLESSTSTDPDGEPLQFVWFMDDDALPVSETAAPTLCAEVGVHTITLVATDPSGATDTTSVTFEVVTAPLAVELLLEAVHQSHVSRPLKRHLVAILRTALVASKRNGGRPDLRTLNAFEAKVRSEVAPRWPDIAAAWIAWSRAIKLGMENCTKIPRTKPVGNIK
jgi:hypothetical protein